MVKVCHLTSVHTRYDTRIFQKECRSLVKAGYDVSLIVCDDLNDETVDGVKIISTNFKPKNRWDRILQGTKLVYEKALNTQADIYHIHDPELLPIARKLKAKGKKVVFDSHEIYYYQIQQKNYLPKFIQKPVAEIYRFYEKHILSMIDAVIVPCTVNGKNYFQNIAKQTVFIDNLPEKDQFRTIPYKDKNSPCKCCYVGSLGASRGTNEIFKIAKETNTNIVLAGNLNALSKEEYKEMNELKAIGILDFRGYTNKDETEKIYDESHIGLSLIHNTGQYNMIDNLPTKVYEYMLAGIPVISSRQPYAEEFFEKYQVGILVDIDDQQEINDAVEYLKNHPQEAKGMGELGRSLVINKYCWEKEVKKLFELYNQLLQEL